MSPRDQPDGVEVLVIGAGPTGLFLALVLAKLGARVRIVDETPGPGTTSRALAVQARTLELYRQVDLAQDVLERGLRLAAVNLWRRGEHAARIELGRIGEGLSPFPFGMIFPQDEHERLLLEKLALLGVTVERRTTLTALEERADSVVATLRGADGASSSCEARYVAGCDGARSTVRATLGAGFPGGTYQHLFYVADVTARGAQMNRELHVMLDEAGFLGLFPLAGEGRARLVGTISDAAGREVTWQDVDRRPIDRIGLQIDRVNWFSTYRVHHRVAERFPRGRLFILGDAAHNHSPVGGQGMNTGLGDAMNLAWKLAAVVGGRAREDLLGTYEPERIAFARRLVSTTDRAFQAASSPGRVAEIVRTQVVPGIVSRVVHTKVGRRLFFRALSQTGIEYRASPWSGESIGAVHAGDRLPWVAPATSGDDNFTPLRSLDWQVHVYGTPAPELRAGCDERHLALHVFPFDDRTQAVDLQKDVVYLIRPDGHVAAAFTASRGIAGVGSYLELHGVRARRS
ncbi:MAG: FAD-dependent oxidoreductase [Myxococcales bacterium]|nr:FAD-dependent oxidoreductase [Myxococcales bacterium]